MNSALSTKTILSTKKLTLSQKELVLNAKLGLVDYNAIDIELLVPELKLKTITNAIFTSKNAVKAIAQTKLTLQHCFCVGEKTKILLEELGYIVVETAKNALELAEIIAQKYNNESFLFFCGNMRRNELPDYLEQNKIELKEQVVYKTKMIEKKIDRSYDGILFFSPSAVQSYCSENSLDNTVAFCIGTTTAAEAKQYTQQIVIANKPTVENVIVQAVKYLNINQ